ncbi:MAG: ubiquinone biosynthesis regulatory protein kinase UbiB [Gammaproteobacteria bacterium]|nr:ubiquinone biosynthesis regulatory protein kinase UbiB [Gammaproteobacteria bacterium]
MINPKLLYRFIYIQYVWVKNGLDDVLTQNRHLAMFRFFVYLNPWYWFGKKIDRGIAIRQTLETLGPLFVKFGQALSTRPDLIPEDIAKELEKLRDQVPPFSSDLVLDIIEKTYRKPVGEIFADFDIEPLAAASIAQVHAATLKTGEQVVVKIRRPDVEKTIGKDIAILKIMAKWAQKYMPQAKRLKPCEVVKEFENHLADELDFRREAANASQLRRNFINSPMLYVPEVYWDYVHINILVIERIDGIPVSDINELKKHQVDFKLLAERGIEIFFTQVFRDCFFHADMHPGNIFVSKQHGYNPQYICVDFGIIGTLNQSDKYYLAQNLLAFFNRDYQTVAELHISSAWIPKHVRVEDFAAAIRVVCEPIFEKPLKDISFASLILQLFNVARRFHLEVQPQLVLLQKTLLAVEGLGRQLYPDLDLWTTAKPFLENWVKQQIGPKAFIKHMKANLPFFVEQLPYMPKLMHEVLLMKKMQYNQKEEKMMKIRNFSSARYASFKMIGIGLLLSSCVYLGYSLPAIIDKLSMLSFLAGAGLMASLLLLMRI